jgi:hypothetical protein
MAIVGFNLLQNLLNIFKKLLHGVSTFGSVDMDLYGC